MGCFDAVVLKVKKHLVIIIAVTASLILFEILGIAFALGLNNAIGQSTSDNDSQLGYGMEMTTGYPAGQPNRGNGRIQSEIDSFM